MNNGGGSFFNVLFGLTVGLVMGCAWLLFYLFMAAVVVVLGIGSAIHQIYKLLKKNKTASVSQVPRPAITPVTKPGPRDWTPREQ